MKYLIIIILIVFINLLFRREGLYNKKNIKKNDFNPNIQDIKDEGITTQQLKDKYSKIDENIFNKPISSIYLNQISLLS